MTIRSCLLSLVALAASMSLYAADGDTANAKAIGTVTAVNIDKKSFTLLEDVTGKSESYRPFYAGGDTGKMADKIPKLTVGEHVQVDYTVKEGRRALAIEDIAK